MHPPQDRVVSIGNAAAIFKAALHPKSFVSLDGADHLLNREEDARFAADVIAAWASRYLPAAAATPLSDAVAEVPIEAGWMEVAETGSGAFASTVRTGAHRWLADEPVSVGGAHAGPSPYDLLSAALGTCTAMTLRMYARQKGLPLDRVRVRLKHSKIHASDCEHCETASGRIDRIEREIELHGALDEAQRQRLQEIADKCPVHRNPARRSACAHAFDALRSRRPCIARRCGLGCRACALNKLPADDRSHDHLLPPSHRPQRPPGFPRVATAGC